MARHRWPKYEFRVPVAGVSFRQDAVSKCYKGQGVELVSEPDNAHVPNAIKVLAGRRHIGYVPRADAVSLTKFIDDEDWNVEAHIDGFFGQGGVRIQVTYQRPWPPVG